MRRSTCGFGVFAALALSAAVAAAQPAQRAGGAREGRVQPAPKNLQVLPKDSSRRQVVAVMQTFTRGLGVRCEYCHVEEGRGGRNDMSLDEKPTKLAARQMMRLVREINARIPAAVNRPASEVTRVECVTCHRGVPIPKQIGEIVAEAAANGGPATGLAKFKALREQFYGGQSYDFSENSLVVIAQRANAAHKPDDALAYLQANLEYFPNSARTYVAMAQVKNGTGDRAAAVKDLDKALQLDPKNMQAERMMQMLKGQ